MNELLGSGSLQVKQHSHGLLRLVSGHEQMIVMDASDDIAADASLAERASKCGGQANSGKVRVDCERDPSCGVGDRQTTLMCELLWNDEGLAFRLANRSDDLIRRDMDVRRSNNKGISAGIERRLHAGEQFLNITNHCCSLPNA